MSTFGVFIISVATTIAVGTTIGFAGQDGALGLTWAAIVGACGAIATVYSFCRQLAIANDRSTPLFRYLFVSIEAILILAIGVVPAAVASRWYFGILPWEHDPHMKIATWLAADEMWPTERLASWLLTCWALVFFGYAICYVLNTALQPTAFKVALTIAKLGWLTFIVGIAIYFKANSPNEVTKMLLVALMTSGGLVLFWAAPRWVESD